MACQGGYADIVKLLLLENANVNDQDPKVHFFHNINHSSLLITNLSILENIYALRSNGTKSKYNFC